MSKGSKGSHNEDTSPAHKGSFRGVSKMAEPSECACEEISSDLTMREALSFSLLHCHYTAVRLLTFINHVPATIICFTIDLITMKLANHVLNL